MITRLDSIRSRISIRRYDQLKTRPEALKALQDLVAQVQPGPFGTRPRFTLVDASDWNAEELRSLATYGMISGARHYLLGAMVPGPGASEDFGWVMEGLILDATALGLGSCWLGGTLDRRAFAKALDLGPDEVLGAASPLGVPADRMGLKNRLIRGFIGADRRRPWGDWTWYLGQGRALEEGDFGPWQPVMEAFRLAPSASNKQPWRVAGNPKTGLWYFFLEENPEYNRRLAPVYLQNMDMGIALRHFSDIARELKLAGGLVPAGPGVPKPAGMPERSAGWQLVATWKSEV